MCVLYCRRNQEDALYIVPNVSPIGYFLLFCDSMGCLYSESCFSEENQQGQEGWKKSENRLTVYSIKLWFNIDVDSPPKKSDNGRKVV